MKPHILFLTLFSLAMISSAAFAQVANESDVSRLSGTESVDWSCLSSDHPGMKVELVENTATDGSAISRSIKLYKNDRLASSDPVLSNEPTHVGRIFYGKKYSLQLQILAIPSVLTRLRDNKEFELHCTRPM